ncbi:flagellin [Salinarimonas rosea]|uniref:flagellin N-terminal helical domain-containing protein n=1 Tax=Salinarimonas rosea TaxID=552063 RepID=UPI0004183BB4|nr:flagellin [Salinarimonas rosea]
MQIALSSGIRNTLLTIQQTTQAANQAEKRLATGLKVSSAVDNPLAFFSAAGLRDRSNDLAGLQDSMQQATRTISAATNGIEGMKKLFETAQGLANQAAAEQDSTARNTLQTQFNEVVRQVDDLMRNSGYGGVNLLNGGTLNVRFDASDTTASLALSVNSGTVLNAATLGVTTGAVGSWTNGAGTLGTAGNANIATALTSIRTAITSLRSEASRLGANNAIVTARQEFTSNMINTLRAGADDWTLADLNEEGAKLTSLNTRNQIAQTALALASQRDQSVLRLF